MEMEEEKKKEEKRKLCDAASFYSQGYRENSFMHDSRLASAVFIQYDRRKGTN